MKEIVDNIWKYFNKDSYLVFTTNGYVKDNCECVMGRGIALDVKNRYPNIPLILGNLIIKKGNRVFKIDNLISFPVKPVNEINNGTNVVNHMKNKFKIEDVVPGWACKARLDIIETSTKQLVRLVNKLNIKNILIVRPGCGNGELNWKDVKLILDKYLDDRFISFSFGQYK